MQIVEHKQCKTCGLSFDITDPDIDFLKKISPKIDGKIFKIPPIGKCVECAKQRRLIRRNKRCTKSNRGICRANYLITPPQTHSSHT